MKFSEFSHQVAHVRCFVVLVMFIVAVNFDFQNSKQSGLLLTLETCGIFVRSAIIVCVLDVRLLLQSVRVDILANCVLISVLLVWLYSVLFTVFPVLYCGVFVIGFAVVWCLLEVMVVVIMCGDNFICCLKWRTSSFTFISRLNALNYTKFRGWNLRCIKV